MGFNSGFKGLIRGSRSNFLLSQYEIHNAHVLALVGNPFVPVFPGESRFCGF